MTYTNPATRAALWFASLSLSFALTSMSRQARAQDPFAEPEPASKGAKSGKSPPPGAEPAAEEAKEEKVDPSADTGGIVERLPPSAYPSWKTRGIYGGSLWLSGSFHGTPWPYYPKTGIGVSGYAWFDTGYSNIARGTMSASEPHEENYMLQQGRAVLRVTPTYSSGDWYLQGQAELVANKDQTQGQSNGVADVDDVWLRTGHWKSWDVQIGRFEGFEVYHFGMGMDLHTLEREGALDRLKPAPDVGGLNWGYLRPRGVGRGALHFYPTDFVRIEILAQAGNESGLNTLGGRPALVLDFGILKLKAAGHYHRQFVVNDTDRQAVYTHGGTAAAQIVLDPRLELGANLDYHYIDRYSGSATGSSVLNFDPRGSYTSVSMGGFLNARLVGDLIAGVGANYNTKTDALEALDANGAPTGVFGNFTHLQTFAAVQYIIRKQLFVKVVGGYALAHLAPTDGMGIWDNSMVSGRIRLLYLF
jgi:hypothetical protein